LGPVRARSHVYATEPVGGPPQGEFLNAGLRVECMQSPEEVLDALLGIEQALGRVRRSEERWGPRTIDLDILWIEGVRVDTPRLTVPHPRLPERAFALAPLLEVAPNAPYALGSSSGIVRTSDLL
jgi:2-amino-4-hydroxy-6-hydroxymethyldihydropteridine diphosphokinase